MMENESSLSISHHGSCDDSLDLFHSFGEDMLASPAGSSSSGSEDGGEDGFLATPDTERLLNELWLEAGLKSNLFPDLD